MLQFGDHFYQKTLLPEYVQRRHQYTKDHHLKPAVMLCNKKLNRHFV